MTLRGSLAVDVNETVTFTFTVENTGESGVDLQFRSGKRADVVVVDADTDETVWRWSEGRMFTQALTQDTLPAGESRTIDLEWPDPAPGEYVAETELTATPGVTASASFTVE